MLCSGAAHGNVGMKSIASFCFSIVGSCYSPADYRPAMLNVDEYTDFADQIGGEVCVSVNLGSAVPLEAVAPGSPCSASRAFLVATTTQALHFFAQ